MVCYTWISRRAALKRAARAGVVLLLMAVLLLSMSVNVQAVTASHNMQYVRVGMKYGADDVPAVNALSESGYRVGWYDDGNVFHEVYTSQARFVAFAKDKNVYISDNSVSDSGGGAAIGAYHLEYDESFATLADALNYIISMGYTNAFPAWIDGVYRVRLGSFGTLADAQSKASAGHTAVGGGARCITMLDMNNPGIILFEFEASDAWPAALPLDPAQKLKNGTTFYYGAFEFKRMDGGDITFISMLTMQQYLKGVLPYEMNPGWNIEALKAQAICARSLTVTNYNSRHKNSGFNMCNTTDCQVYYGTTSESALVARAVDETNGQVAMYAGEVAETYYHSSSGGYTDSDTNVWGGNHRPYLNPVPDTYENSASAYNGVWTSTVPLSELSVYLQDKGYKIGNIVKCYISEYTQPAGNVYAMTFEDSVGEKLVIERCERVRIALNKYVKSARFTLGGASEIYLAGSRTTTASSLTGMTLLGANGTTLITQPGTLSALGASGALSVNQGGGGASSGDTVVFTGSGWGHNVGMSQYGAKGMADNGFSYDEIVKYYYQGVEVVTLPELMVQ